MSNPLPAAGAAPAVPAVPVQDAATQEVRFAVVMYGGVSLCIYINGIAQELLHLVRATAPGDAPGTLRYADDQLEPVERVYRDLGRLLVEGRAPGAPMADGAPVSTRFSVDILSGTSAGGINAIFLAKALTNDESMAQLKQLWMTEGDIAKLINDGASTRDTGLPRPSPQALLNGQRMYQKLVVAFDGMDDAAQVRNDTPARPPLVPELDLFVTTTDIAGVTLPIRLSDGVVHERRHRGVFHFRYKKEDGVDPPEPNDFSRRYNPFLAFAARCTSAFPFAFEPMRLKHVDEVLDTIDAYRGRPEGRADDPRWAPFLERFQTPLGTAQVPPRERSFGDGGYLDNKPFSYASETLLGRESAIPVDRKLIYIEPAPEHPERDAARTEFDAIENVMAATVGLPRYETIREDLERLLTRNRLTERVRIITQALEDDIPHRRRRQSIKPAADWGAQYLDTMVEEHGLAYGAYHRLRVAATTDWLARVVSRAAGIADGSDLVLAVRHLVRAWRDRNFAPHNDRGTETRRSENRFLLDYDLAFRVRRMGYLLGKINWLHGWDRQAESAVRQIARHAAPGGETMMAALARSEATTLSREEKAEFRAELVALKSAFHTCHRQMRRAEEEMEVRGESNPFRARVGALGLDPRELTDLLALSSAARDAESQLLLGAGTREEELRRFADAVETRVLQARQPASVEVARLLDPRTAAPASSPARQLARDVLWHYYQHYGDYDMVSFPILYSTDAGEQDTVDVIRISPEDATFIFDEGRDPLGRRKLAGTALFSFGGFLRDTWRANDILWGRLDGAERIICSLLPGAGDQALRADLLKRASVAILQDEFKTATRGEVSRLMSESLVSVAAGRPAESAVARLSAAVGNEQLGTRLQAVLGDCLDDDKLLAYFKQAYEVNRDLDPAETLESLARGSRVVGQMLEGISERHSIEGKRVRWVTRAGTWFWGLVQVAVPRSLPSLIFDHWLGLFYALSLLLVLVGVFAGAEVMGWGARVLGVTVAANVIVLLLRDYMRRRGAVAAFLVGIAVVAAAGLVVAGFAWIAEYVVTRGIEERLPALLQLGPATRTGTLQGLCMVLGGLMVVAAALPQLTRRWKRWLPGGFSAPGLAAEFVEDADQLAKLTRGALLPAIPETPNETPAMRSARLAQDRLRERHRKEIPKKVITGVYVDYLFIAAYWILFVLLADRLVQVALSNPFLLRPLSNGIAGFLGLAAGDVARVVRDVVLGAGIGALVTGTAAAVLDVVENGRIHEAFTAGRGREENWMAEGIRTAAVWKWALVFVTVLLLSPLFVWQTEPRRVLGLFWMNGQVLGVFWIAVAVAGLASLWKRPRWVEIVMLLLGLGLVAARFLLPAV